MSICQLRLSKFSALFIRFQAFVHLPLFKSPDVDNTCSNICSYTISSFTTVFLLLWLTSRWFCYYLLLFCCYFRRANFWLPGASSISYLLPLSFPAVYSFCSFLTRSWTFSALIFSHSSFLIYTFKAINFSQSNAFAVSHKFW